LSLLKLWENYEKKRLLFPKALKFRLSINRFSDLLSYNAFPTFVSGFIVATLFEITAAGTVQEFSPDFPFLLTLQK
jgi:hypothetical protein